MAAVNVLVIFLDQLIPLDSPNWHHYYLVGLHIRCLSQDGTLKLLRNCSFVLAHLADNSESSDTPWNETISHESELSLMPSQPLGILLFVKNWKILGAGTSQCQKWVHPENNNVEDLYLKYSVRSANYLGMISINLERIYIIEINIYVFNLRSESSNINLCVRLPIICFGLERLNTSFSGI